MSGIVYRLRSYRFEDCTPVKVAGVYNSIYFHSISDMFDFIRTNYGSDFIDDGRKVSCEDICRKLKDKRVCFFHNGEEYIHGLSIEDASRINLKIELKGENKI